MNSSTALLLIPLAPLAAAVAAYILALFPRRWTAAACSWLGIGAMAVSALLAAQLLRLEDVAFSVPWFTLPDSAIFMDSGGQLAGLALDFALTGQPAQLLFALTTACITLAVLVFAIRERRGDARAPQFFATLTLFAGSMLLFLTADTLLVLYIAWELMGVCSYLLIAHPATAEARRAARQAFWTTRATDFGLLFAVFGLLTAFKWPTVSAIDVSGALSQMMQAGGDTAAFRAVLGAMALLTLLAALGKAAQLPLCFWLPDAMVAPAPVSALLHAATMVAAGPYLLIRCWALFSASELALSAAVILGGLTLLLGGLMALNAAEPKRILAYSTVSQLGLVIMSVGVFSEEAGFYHLLAHAWFKAALFLGVGYLVAVVAVQKLSSGGDGHAAGRLNDYAGAARSKPLLLWGVLVPAGLSLLGLWPLAGALGKEHIVHALLTRAATEVAPGVTLGSQFQMAAVAWEIGAVLCILALPVTAAYITRLVVVLGWGVGPESRTAQAAGSWTAGLVSAVVLAGMGSLGWALAFPWFRQVFASKLTWKWAELGTATSLGILVLSLLLCLAGAGLAWLMLMARPGLGRRLHARRWLERSCRFFAAGMYLREVFQTLVGKTGEFCALLAAIFEQGVLDWLVLRCGSFGRSLAFLARWVDDHVIEGARWWICELAWICKRAHGRLMQTGQLHHYMFIVLLSAAVLCVMVLKPLGEIFARILERL